MENLDVFQSSDLFWKKLLMFFKKEFIKKLSPTFSLSGDDAYGLCEKPCFGSDQILGVSHVLITHNFY